MTFMKLLLPCALRPVMLALLVVGSMTAVRAATPVIPRLQSPDARIAVDLRAGDRLSYDVVIDERVVLKDSTLALQLEQTTFGPQSVVVKTTTGQHDAVVKP